jgi:hypothetical protein
LLKNAPQRRRQHWGAVNVVHDFKQRAEILSDRERQLTLIRTAEATLFDVCLLFV